MISNLHAICRLIRKNQSQTNTSPKRDVGRLPKTKDALPRAASASPDFRANYRRARRQKRTRWSPAGSLTRSMAGRNKCAMTSCTMSSFQHTLPCSLADESSRGVGLLRAKKRGTLARCRRKNRMDKRGMFRRCGGRCETVNEEM